MTRDKIWLLAKVLEALGLLVVLAGIAMSVRLGFQDAGLASMGAEFRGLLVGGALFVAGWLLESRFRMR